MFLYLEVDITKKVTRAGAMWFLLFIFRAAFIVKTQSGSGRVFIGCVKRRSNEKVKKLSSSLLIYTV